jgi:molecular chaperone Hsp33
VTSTFDIILPFQLENSAIRGRLVRLDQELWKIIDQHRYPAIVNTYLTQATVLAIALAASFKFDGVFTLQIGGSGPLHLLVVDILNHGQVRACARFHEEDLNALKPEDAKNSQQVFGQGTLIFTIETTDTEKQYQGVVELTGTTLAESIHHFFRQSEQLETGVVLAGCDLAEWSSEDRPLSGAALMIQRLPLPLATPPEEKEARDDQWIHALSMAGSVTRQELLDRSLSNEDLLHRLFWEGGVRLHGSQSIIANCRCSSEKIKNMLAVFSEQDRQTMVVDGKITVSCEFCGKQYEFREAEFEIER